MKNKNGTLRHKERIFELRDKGYTYNQIQAELNCSKGTISYHLGEGQIVKTNKRKERRREESNRLLRGIKEESGCVDCKVKYPYYKLDFDHVRGEKRDNLSRMTRWYSYDEVMEEIKKCDIVCSNCHRERTHKRSLGL
jgi:hypothetical protein